MLGRRSNNADGPGARVSNSSALETIIGRKTEFDGDISFSGGLRVDGKVSGNINASAGKDASLVLSDSGQIEGNVDVDNVIINGVVNGNVVSSGKVELQPNARINGDVHYKVIEMALGSAVNGSMVRTVDSVSGSKVDTLSGPKSKK